MTALIRPLTAPVGRRVSLTREWPALTGCTSVVADALAAFCRPLTAPAGRLAAFTR
jgi:hypothetical protein